MIHKRTVLAWLAATVALIATCFAAAPAQAATTKSFIITCHSVKTNSEIVLRGEWRKTSTTVTGQHIKVINTSDLDFHITRLRFTDETTGKYVNGYTGNLHPGRATASWSPKWSAPRKHRVVLALKGYMEKYFTDTVGCGSRP